MYQRKTKETHFYEKNSENNSDSEQSDVATNATTYIPAPISQKLLEQISFILKNIIKNKKTNFQKNQKKFFIIQKSQRFQSMIIYIELKNIL